MFSAGYLCYISGILYQFLQLSNLKVYPLAKSRDLIYLRSFPLIRVRSQTVRFGLKFVLCPHLFVLLKMSTNMDMVITYVPV